MTTTSHRVVGAECPMIPASRSVETVKKIINLPDPMVLDIDRLAIGDYGKRSNFVETAIRIYKRDLTRLNAELSMTVQNSNLNMDEAAKKQYEMFQECLRKDLERYEKYGSDDVTAVGLYLTDELLRYIDVFIDKNGPIKNLQMFARMAVARELKTYELSAPKIIAL